ncbi:MAG: YlxR family protein [Ruminococcaceae bacterium]|nr:YlxR family protein [Oscillospiraceae bacterium]
MAEKQKHIPLRKCMGCQEMLPKQSLIRIVKDSEGIRLDPTGKADGRGAYLCGKADCLKRVIKSRRLDKVLHTQIPAEIYTKLEELSSNMEVR